MRIDSYLLIGIIAALTFGLGWLLARLAQVRAQSERTGHSERLQADQEAQRALRDAFQSLSAEALQTNNRTFLDLAETRLREARSEAASDIDARKKAIEDLLSPLAKTLEQVDREIKESERRRGESGAQLLQQIASLDQTGQSLQSETRRLVDALKRPGVRGQWGELQLKRVVELAGMVERCDFDEQQTFTDQSSGDGDRVRRMRPDVVVRLPVASAWSWTRRFHSTRICGPSKHLIMSPVNRCWPTTLVRCGHISPSFRVRTTLHTSILALDLS